LPTVSMLHSVTSAFSQLTVLCFFCDVICFATARACNLPLSDLLKLSMRGVTAVEKAPLWLAWSTGKDSALALHTLRHDSRWEGFEVHKLLSTITVDYGRVSMHGVRVELLRAQAELLGMPLVEVFIRAGCTNEEYEQAMRNVLKDALDEGVYGVAFGDIHLEDVRQYRENQMAQVGIKPIFPLWHESPTELALKFISLGYKALVVCVDSQRLDPSFCGRAFDESFLSELPSSVDPCGENGEFHTFVYDGPLFAEPIKVRRGEIVIRDERFAFCELELER